MRIYFKLLLVLLVSVALSIVFVERAYASDLNNIDEMHENIQVLEERKAVAEELIENAKKLGYKDTHEIVIEAKEIMEQTSIEIEASLNLIETMKKQEEEAKKQLELKEQQRLEEIKKIEDSKKRLIYDVYSKTNLSAEDFNILLSKTSLAGMGASFKYIEDKENINGLFAIAVATQESSCGKYNANKNNFWGRRSSGSGWMSWSTADESIKSFGKYMNNKMYYGKSIEDIAKTYCPPTHSDWAYKVKLHMRNYWDKLDY